MYIKITEAPARILQAELAKVGVNVADHFRYASGREKSLKVDLARVPVPLCKQLVTLLETQKKGSRIIALAIRDTKLWIAAKEDTSLNVKAPTEEAFTKLLIEYMRRAPRHHLYKKEADGFWYCYLVQNIEYHPPQRGKKYYHPAYTSMPLIWRTQEGVVKYGHTVNHEGVNTRPVDMLNTHAYFTETPELRAVYEAERARYNDLVGAVGKQFYAKGTAKSGSWTLRLEYHGEQSRVVVDTLSDDDTGGGSTEEDEDEDEDAEADDGTETFVATDFWRNASPLDETRLARLGKKGKYDSEDDVDDGADIDENVETQADEEDLVEVPIHPSVMTFDLKRHLRYSVHVNNLTEYIYDTKLGEKLVLPRETRELIDVLLAHTGGFRDIIKGKGGGASILCTGIAGSGKTLTAEVYSEVAERPLYAVQAAQLGLDAAELEKSLLQVFKRALRWNAILLIDEADVYLHERGDDIQQNAIVGAFLRTLEYYQGVLFMTSNRGDSIDDAIASRCIARITYDIPTAEDQIKIWQILAREQRIKIPDAIAVKLAAEFPRATGRDIKNLLKLGGLMAAAHKKTLSVEILRTVSKFKPTT